GNVHTLFRFRHSAAEDYVFDFFGINLRHSIQRAFDGNRSQLIGTGGAQRAFEGASNRGADRRDQNNFAHVNSSGWTVLSSKNHYRLLRRRKSHEGSQCSSSAWVYKYAYWFRRRLPLTPSLFRIMSGGGGYSMQYPWLSPPSLPRVRLQRSTLPHLRRLCPYPIRVRFADRR